jgi:hypothetical protein
VSAENVVGRKHAEFELKVKGEFWMINAIACNRGPNTQRWKMCFSCRFRAKNSKKWCCAICFKICC